MENIDYNSFAKTYLEELKVLQEKFQFEYDVDGCENWFYNQATGLLTLSNNKIEHNFKYFQIGSYSKKSGTWKWSWVDNDILENEKGSTKDIKEFGQKHGFIKLPDEYFKSDEFEAWEFAAIATKLSGGIGVYRPVIDEYLQLFLVITESVDNETAQNIKDKYVDCSVHEYQRIAFVCQHLNKNTKLGFEEAFDTFEGMELSEEDNFQAWCNECEKVRESEGEWNDNSMAFSQIKLVCEKCYFEMKEFSKSIV